MTDPTVQPPTLDPPSPHVRPSERVAGWVAAALRLHAMAERVLWDVEFHANVTPAGMHPRVFVSLQIPSALLGQHIATGFFVTMTDLQEERVREAVGRAMSELFAARLRANLPTAGPAVAPGARMKLPPRPSNPSTN